MVDTLIDHLDQEDHDADWSSIAVVVEFDGNDVSGTHGYAYGEKPIAVAPDPWGIESAVHAYLADRYGPDDALPVKMLVQYERRSGRYDVTFENADRTRWQVTPASIDTIREELRPRLA